MTALAASGDAAEGSTVVAPYSVSRSHVGLVRAINEDRIFDCTKAGLWAVVDGMGGHRGGDVAAQMVVDGLRDAVMTEAPLRAAAMLVALENANTVILERNARSGLDAGATVVAASIQDDFLQIAWAGDSRCYLVRGDQVDQLTHDHSVVQELVDAGLLTPAMAERHPQANVVTRALGVHANANLATATAQLTAGDRILLCSDGLSRTLRNDELVTGATIVQLADRLVTHALARDGTDNISLVLLQI